MAVDRATKARVLKNHSRAIVHMRQQIEDQRFGLVVGAGASLDLGFPDWPKLIDRIANHPKVQGSHLLTLGEKNTSQSQILYEHYRAKLAAEAGIVDPAFDRHNSEVRAGWQKIVHAELYRDVPEDPKDLFGQDSYLHGFLDVIRKTRLTINYNFDDSIQRMLDHKYPPKPEERRSHSTVWNENIQMFPRNGVIYHPNGYLPYSLTDRASEQLIFLEDSFADQLIESMAGHYTGLSYHLAQATRLLLGLSLADATLKHLLRQNALNYPGHYHYYIAFVPDEEARNEEYEHRVVDANFAVYNLITLFLTRKDIEALAMLLTMPSGEFRHFADECGVDPMYRFLITGAVGAGKSTMVSNFRSLRSYDEWLEPRRPGMEKDPSKLDSDTIRAIDSWVNRQLYLKNLAMLDAKEGVHIVDRAPLDAFAFGPRDGWATKARQIREAIAPDESNKRLVPAHIILLTGDPEVMAVRAISKHKETDGDALKEQQKLLLKIYTGDGVSVVDTRDKSAKQVVKEIASIIHRQKYAQMDLAGRLDQLEQSNHDTN